MKLTTAALATTLFACSIAAVANPTGSGSAGLSANVPLTCQVDNYSVALDRESPSATGAVHETCNGGHGFRVVATYRPLAANEHVQIDYGGQLSHLDATGFTQIAYRPGASFKMVPVSIETRGLTSNVSISIGVTAA